MKRKPSAGRNLKFPADVLNTPNGTQTRTCQGAKSALAPNSSGTSPRLRVRQPCFPSTSASPLAPSRELPSYLGLARTSVSRSLTSSAGRTGPAAGDAPWLGSFVFAFVNARDGICGYELRALLHVSHSGVFPHPGKPRKGCAALGHAHRPRTSSPGR